MPDNAVELQGAAPDRANYLGSAQDFVIGHRRNIPVYIVGGEPFEAGSACLIEMKQDKLLISLPALLKDNLRQK